jgi:hypothetical protein
MLVKESLEDFLEPKSKEELREMIREMPSIRDKIFTVIDHGLTDMLPEVWDEVSRINWQNPNLILRTYLNYHSVINPAIVKFLLNKEGADPQGMFHEVAMELDKEGAEEALVAIADELAGSERISATVSNTLSYFIGRRPKVFRRLVRKHEGADVFTFEGAIAAINRNNGEMVAWMLDNVAFSGKQVKAFKDFAAAHDRHNALRAIKARINNQRDQ